MVYRSMPGEGSSAGPGAGETGEPSTAGSLAGTGVASVLLCRAAEKRFLAGAGILSGAAQNRACIKNWLSALLASLM